MYVYTYTLYVYLSHIESLPRAELFNSCVCCMLRLTIRNQKWCSQRSIRFLNQLVGTGWITMNPIFCVSFTVLCFFRQTVSISCHLFLVTVGFWGLSELWIVRCSSMVALEDNLSSRARGWFFHIFSIHDGSATFCLSTTSYFRRFPLCWLEHCLLGLGLRRCNKPQITRIVAIQTGLQYLTVVHIWHCLPRVWLMQALKTAFFQLPLLGTDLKNPNTLSWGSAYCW